MLKKIIIKKDNPKRKKGEPEEIFQIYVNFVFYETKLAKASKAALSESTIIKIYWYGPPFSFRSAILNCLFYSGTVVNKEN